MNYDRYRYLPTLIFENVIRFYVAKKIDNNMIIYLIYWIGTYQHLSINYKQ